MKNEALQMRKYSSTTYMILAALFAAMTAVCSWIYIPLPFTPVPINLATLAVFLAGSLLGHTYGPISMVVYVLVGAIGVPVFAGGTGGLGIITGPTGGYILGYIAAAAIIGSMTSRLDSKKIYILVISMVTGLIACYALGTIWFCIVTGMGGGSVGIGAALMMCVVPFLPGDGLKIICAVFITKKIRPHIF